MNTPTKTPEPCKRAPARVVQEWLAQTGQSSWTVPAQEVHHLRRALYAAQTAACERLAVEAAQMLHAAETDQYVRRSPGHVAAIGHHGDVCAVLDLVGWDCWGSTSGDEPPFPREISISLLENLGVLRHALTLEVANMRSRGDDDAAAVGALLAELNGLVDEADAADVERARSKQARAAGREVGLLGEPEPAEAA